MAAERYRLDGFIDPSEPGAPVYTHDCSSLASVGGHLGHLAADCPTILCWRVAADGQRTLVMRYDRDGYDL